MAKPQRIVLKIVPTRHNGNHRGSHGFSATQLERKYGEGGSLGSILVAVCDVHFGVQVVTVLGVYCNYLMTVRLYEYNVLGDG